MNAHVNEDCIGCGLCPTLCPEVFHMTAEGLAEAIEEPVPTENEAAALEARDSCPVSAIETD